MGAGEYTAGEFDIAGEDPVAALSPRRNLKPPVALVFDPETRTFLRDDNGRLKSVHPVDHKVTMAIFIEFGKITSAPNTGSTLKQIKYLDPQKIETDVRNRVHRALDAVLQPGDIEEMSLAVSQPTRWSIRIVYEYKNLRDPNSRPRVLELTNGG